MFEYNPEDQLINRMAIHDALAALKPADREMIAMIFDYERPVDYDGQWPATLTDIGRHIGLKYKGKPLSEATIRNRRDAIKKLWEKDAGRYTL